jgi:uncharacterized protein involved in cysteine biosynthesis
MIHQWFVHFGLAALLFAVGGYAVTRFAFNHHHRKQSDDQQSYAWVSILSLVVIVVAGLIALILLLIGVSASIPGWIAALFAGITVGIAQEVD